MHLEDEIVRLCTRQRFSEAHQQNLQTLCQNHPIDWEVVFKTAAWHNVSPLVYWNLQNSLGENLNIPAQVESAFKKTYMENVFVKRGTAKALDEVLALFNRKGIAVMLVKGEALNATVYAEPWYTISYDIDLVIKAERSEIDADDQREIVNALETFNAERTKFSEHIEYDYFEHHDITMNHILAVDMRRIWREAHKIKIHGHDVFIMTPEDTLIATAIQSCRKRFFRLKTLCDIATIIEETPTLDWEILLSKAQAYECNTIMYTALLVTQSILGCTLPAEFLSRLKVSRGRMALINYLVKKLCQRFSLLELHNRSTGTFLGREFSWPLVLTYTTYRRKHLLPKIKEIYHERHLILPATTH